MQPEKVRVPLFPHKRSAEDLSGTLTFSGRGDRICFACSLKISIMLRTYIYQALWEMVKIDKSPEGSISLSIIVVSFVVSFQNVFSK